MYMYMYTQSYIYKCTCHDVIIITLVMYSIYMYTYMYIYMYIHVYTYMYMYLLNPLQGRTHTCISLSAIKGSCGRVREKDTRQLPKESGVSGDPHMFDCGCP